MRTHTGEKTYLCIQCDEEFSYASQLKVRYIRGLVQRKSHIHVITILCYGFEIWGTKMRSEIEIVHNQFCKYVLG